MKNIFLIFIFLIMSSNILKGQSVIIFYDDYHILRSVDIPGFVFQKFCPNNNKIQLNDTTLINFLNKKIKSLKTCDTCKGSMNTQIQVVLIESNGSYNILNLYHNYCKDVPQPYIKMELNGNQVFFDLELQLIIDKLIKYHIDNNKKNHIDKDIINSIMHSILAH